MATNNKRRIIVRSDTLVNWLSLNPVPANNELVYVSDSTIANFKVGDGVTAFNSLPYIGADKYPFRGLFPVGTVTQIRKNDVWEDSLSGTPYVALQDFSTSVNPVAGTQWAMFWYVTQDQLAPFAQNRVSRIVQDKATGLWNRTYYSNIKSAFGGPGSGIPAIPAGSVVVAAAPAGDEIYGNFEQVNIASGCTFNTGGYNLGDPIGYTRPNGTSVPFTSGDVITVNSGKTTIIGNNATVYVNATGNWGLGMYGSPADLDLIVNNLNFESRAISVCFKINAGVAVHTGNISVLGGGSGLSSGGTGVLKSTGDINVVNGAAFRVFNSATLTHYGNSRVIKGSTQMPITTASGVLTIVGGFLDYAQFVGSPISMAGTVILQDVTVIHNGNHLGAPTSASATAKIYLRGETIYNVTAPVPAGLTIIDERVAAGGSSVNDANLVHKTGDETVAGVKTLTNQLSINAVGNYSTPLLKVVGAYGSDVAKVNILGGSNDAQRLEIGQNSNASSFIMQGAYAPLDFGTNGTYRMRITENGDFGFGTNAPDAKLHIAGLYPGSKIGLHTSGDIVMDQGVNLFFNGLYSYNNGTYIGRNYANGVEGNLEVVLNGQGVVAFAPGGKTGFGTSSPTEKVEVVGNVKANFFIGDGSRLTNLPSVTVEPITYATLTQRIAASGLVVGKWYLITDYQTVHTIPNTQDVNSASVEPLYVLAGTVKSLVPEAYSSLHPEDIIYYNPTNDQNILPGCTKGYISRRIDTKFNNDFGFDFREIVVRRWKDSSNEYVLSYYGGTSTIADFTEGRVFNTAQYQSNAYTNNKWERNSETPVFNAFDIFFGADTYCYNTTAEMGATLTDITILRGSVIENSKLGAKFSSFTSVFILDNSSISGLDLGETSVLYGVRIANSSAIQGMEIKKSTLSNIQLNTGSLYDCHLLDSSNFDNITITGGNSISGLNMRASLFIGKDFSSYGINSVRMVDSIFDASVDMQAGHGIDNSVFYDCDSSFVFGANDFSHKFYFKNKEVGSGTLTEVDTIANFRTRFNTNGEIPKKGVTYIVTGRTSVTPGPQNVDGPNDTGDGTASGFNGFGSWNFVENSPGGSYSLKLTTYGTYYGQVQVETPAGSYVDYAYDYNEKTIDSAVPRGGVVTYVLYDYQGFRISYTLTAPVDGAPQPAEDVYGEFHMASGDNYGAFMNVATVGDFEGAFTYELLTDTLKPLSNDIVVEQNLNSNSQTNVPSVYAVQTAMNLKAPLESPNFSGYPTTPTPYYGDQSTRIASTQFVYDVLGQNAIVYRTGYPPTPMYVNLGIFSGDTTPHELMEIRGMFGNLYLRYQDYNIHGYNAIVNSVWIVDGGPGRKITIHGLTSKGTWHIHESTEDGTGIGLVANINYCTIPALGSFQLRSGGYRDKHSFTHCKIGFIYREAAYNGTAGHTLDFDQCSFGEGVTSGYLIGDFQPGEMSPRFNNCTFRLSGTAQVGPPNPANSFYPNLQFHNCTVINADGTSYRLDNAGVIAHRSGNAVKFENDAEYDPIYSGTFTVDATIKTIGAVVTIYLGPSAMEPTIPTTGFKKISGTYTAGSNLMYMFKVGANNQIQYTITNLD